ncbi:MAG: hypothetical protein ABII88_07680 [Candidatus Omnitrophota bacterium]
MRYDEFKAKVRGFPVLSTQLLQLLSGEDAGFSVQLGRWVNAGKVIQLKKGIYLLNELDRKIMPSRLYLAGELYKPSYISLEYALAYYGLIPEKVADVTCVCAKKTAMFQTPLGRFIYQHVKDGCFNGFRQVKDESGLNFFIASPEKALVDFFYLNLGLFKKDYVLVGRESLRLQNMKTLDWEKLLSLAGLFRVKKLMEVVRAFREENND